VRTLIVYRIFKDTRQIVPIVKWRERRKHERGSNAADMMRLAKQLCAGANAPFYLIVASENETRSNEPRTDLE
jgi:hypothetical protein